MKTKIFGKKIVNAYEVVSNQKPVEDENGEPKMVFTAKPTIVTHTEVEDWEQIVPDIDGEIKCNRIPIGDTLIGSVSINISADETVNIDKEIYRADLNEMHVFTDKVVSERDYCYCKEEAEKRLAELIGDYNEQIIASDEKMTAYCKLHKLDIREADCEEVFELVYPEKTFKIKDGAVYINVKTVAIHADDYPIAKYPPYLNPISFTCDTTSTYVTNTCTASTTASMR